MVQGWGYEAGWGGGGGVQRAGVQTALGQVLERGPGLLQWRGSLCVKKRPPASVQSAPMLADVLPVPFSQLRPPAAKNTPPKKETQKTHTHPTPRTGRTGLRFNVPCALPLQRARTATAQSPHTHPWGGINTMWSIYF